MTNFSLGKICSEDKYQNRGSVLFYWGTKRVKTDARLHNNKITYKVSRFEDWKGGSAAKDTQLKGQTYDWR